MSARWLLNSSGERGFDAKVNYVRHPALRPEVDPDESVDNATTAGPEPAQPVRPPKLQKVAALSRRYRNRLN